MADDEIQLMEITNPRKKRTRRKRKVIDKAPSTCKRYGMC